MHATVSWYGEAIVHGTVASDAHYGHPRYYRQPREGPPSLAVLVLSHRAVYCSAYSKARSASS